MGKGLDGDRKGHDKIRTGPGEARIRTWQYLPTRGKGHARQIGQPISARTRSNSGKQKIG